VAVTLAQYLQKVRFYLRDYYATAYQQQDLIDCINQARANITTDAYCMRALVTMNMVTNQAGPYTFSSVLTAVQQQVAANAAAICFINSIAVYWSSTLKPTLDYMDWNDMNAFFLSFTGFTFIPSVWSMYADLQSFYVAPIPNQTYEMEVDCIYLPNVLVNTTDVDLLPPVVADLQLIPYAACSIAKIHQNSHGEAARFDAMYQDQFNRRFSGQPAFRVASRYGTSVMPP
jgi:hypothetical protein